MANGTLLMVNVLSASLSLNTVQQRMQVARKATDGVVERRLQGCDNLGDELVLARQGCQSLHLISAQEFAVGRNGADELDGRVGLGERSQNLGGSYLVLHVEGVE